MKLPKTIMMAVNEDDIANGITNSACFCPFARAFDLNPPFKDYTTRGIFACNEDPNIDDRYFTELRDRYAPGIIVKYISSEAATKAIKKFDKTGTMEPGEYEWFLEEGEDPT